LRVHLAGFSPQKRLAPVVHARGEPFAVEFAAPVRAQRRQPDRQQDHLVFGSRMLIQCWRMVQVPMWVPMCVLLDSPHAENQKKNKGAAQCFGGGPQAGSQQAL